MALTFQQQLLRWFEKHQRDLPWRRDRDAYHIWVSEVMLQQTTVATVTPRFLRFLTRFPTIIDLAQADEQAVLLEWEGLGYYRRARNMHRAARMLAKLGSDLPDDPAVWSELPGVGRYILGAVLSQAFDRRLPIVEANSQRVLCRLFARRGDPAQGDVKKWLWQKAEEILPRRRVGDFNQALMELGATVCIPTAPRCDICPVARHCQAFQQGIQGEIPEKSARPAVEKVDEVAVVIRRGVKALLVQRPSVGRWSNMWEFPHVTLEKGQTHHAAALQLLNAFGLKADLGGEIMTIRHAVTRFRITMVCIEARYRSGTIGKIAYPDAKWLSPAEWHDYPVSTPQRKLANELAKDSRQLRLF